MQALKDSFYYVSYTRRKQYVQTYNDLFLQCRMDSAALSYVFMPDKRNEMDTYPETPSRAGLTEDTLHAVQDHGDFAQISSVKN